jgi:3-phosphoshikimate 1-carboxyvinyltransferase
MTVAIIRYIDAPLRGVIKLPGDKSISHRRALLSLLCNESVHLENFGPGKDCKATLDCIKRLGKSVKVSGDDVTITGEMSAHEAELDAANSGTTARLTMGLLAGIKGKWTIKGDASLSRRPMERVATPLRKMGAQIELTDGKLPARIIGGKLQSIRYELPVPSAQVKTAILLAALHADGITEIREQIPTRDHTERILGLHPVRENNTNLWRLNPSEVRINGDVLSAPIPGDISSGTFWMVAAALIKGSQLSLKNISLNPSRTGVINVHQKVGMKISTENLHDSGGEPVGDLTITRDGSLKGFYLAGRDTAAVIDEIPALAVMATQCKGQTVVSGAGELRVKESDRLAAIVLNLRKMGVQILNTENGFSLTGTQPLSSATINPAGDHRIAMAFALAGLIADGETEILQAECADISYPQFWQELNRISGNAVQLREER